MRRPARLLRMIDRAIEPVTLEEMPHDRLLADFFADRHALLARALGT